MNAKIIITTMQEQGFELSLTAAGGLAVTPASLLNTQQRELIRDNKVAIIASLTAANDPHAPDPTATTQDAPPTQPATDIGTRRPPGLSPKLLAASQALDAQIAASGVETGDPDECCYPHTQAASGAELDTMATRLERFARIGLPIDQAEKLADRLKDRDRDPADGRNLCLECQHCQHGRCSNSRAAGLNHPELGQDYALLLKRCNGYTAGIGTLAGPVLGFAKIPPKPPQQYHPLTPDQQQAARDYHAHHFGCPKCRVSSQSGARCTIGQALWVKYQGGGDG